MYCHAGLPKLGRCVYVVLFAAAAWLSALALSSAHLTESGEVVVAKLRTAVLSHSELGSVASNPPLGKSDARWLEVAGALEYNGRDELETDALPGAPEGTRGRAILEESGGEVCGSLYSSGDANTFRSRAENWWREANALQVIVSFLDSEAPSRDSLSQVLGSKGFIADFIGGGAYVAVVAEDRLLDLQARLKDVAVVSVYENLHKISPELTTLTQLLSTGSVSEVAVAPHARFVDVLPNLSIEIVSKNSIDTRTKESAGAVQANATDRESYKPLAVNAYNIKLKDVNNATLDFFSVAVDQYERLLLTASTPTVEGLQVDNMMEALSLLVAGCCGSEVGNSQASCHVSLAHREIYLEQTEHARESVSFRLAVPGEHIEAMVAALAGLPFINWVEPELEAVVFNYAASSTLQTGSADYEDPATRPFWDIGLTGAGQIVGVGDTGLDMKSCFFYDPDHEVGFNHRKVVGYRGFADYDDTSGHGTHVCSSIAGKSSREGFQDDNGMAPGAKLAFTDLGLSYGDQRGLIAPETMSEYYKYAYNLGARLHSDSWEGLSTAYTRSAREVDEYHFYHPEFLAMIAAGNDGEYISADEAESTVSTPATCKNALSIGATFSTGWSDPPGDPIGVFDLVHPDVLRTTFEVVSSLFSPEFAFEPDEELEVISLYPPRVCGALSVEDLESVKDRVVLVERGDCFFIEKVTVLRDAGAKGVIIYNNLESGMGFFKMASADYGYQTDIPTSSVPLSTGRMLQNAMDHSSNSNGTVTIQFVRRANKGVPAFDSVAEYSSFGPTRDGRVKPDVVAPGESIQSATSVEKENECSTKRISGTSMATPLVAGISAIIRQYIMDEWYASDNATLVEVNGDLINLEAVTPTGALIKAIMINGAVPLHGFDSSGLPLETAPSFRQGWGRVQLDTSIALPGEGKTIQFADWKNLESEGEVHEYCLKTGDNVDEPIKITLTWMDAPGSLSSGGVLVNDLDLDVEVPAGAAEAHWGAAERPDRKNNVERATLLYPEPNSLYRVNVTAHTLNWEMGSGRGQLYALALFGGDGMLLSHEPCSDEEQYKLVPHEQGSGDEQQDGANVAATAD